MQREALVVIETGEQGVTLVHENPAELPRAEWHPGTSAPRVFFPLWRCAVCGGHFLPEDMELLEDDEQACLRCARPHLLAPAAALAALSTGQL
jgi:hypothetical protein